MAKSFTELEAASVEQAVKMVRERVRQAIKAEIARIQKEVDQVEEAVPEEELELLTAPAIKGGK